MNNKPSSPTKNSLHIQSGTSRTAAIQSIKNALKTHKWVLIVDLFDVTFPLHRDFFLVLSRKFPNDRYILRVKNSKTAALAKSLGIQVETNSAQSEFERKYENQNLATHNMSMFEYFLYEIKRGFLYLKFLLLERKKNTEKIPQYKKRSSNFFLIIAGLIVSVTLLLFIFHFAISRTVVHITPDIIVRPVSANILYRPANATGSILDNRTTLALKKIKFPIEAIMKFRIDTIDHEASTSAKGNITIYNELTVEQKLRPGTRFLTSEGMIFRSQDWVTVPRSRSMNGITEMGMTTVEVVADAYDRSGKFVGGRWNIPEGIDMTIPGLKFNRDKIYAKSQAGFSGGTDSKEHIVTEEEVNKFKGILEEKLQKLGREEITKKLETQKQEKQEDFALLVGDAVSYTGTTFEIISGQNIGDKSDEIELKWTTQISATVFDRKATIEYLTQIFRDNLLAGTDKEIGIHPDTLHVSNVVHKSDDNNEFKLTLEMNASVSYDFENSRNELTRRLKTLIAGISKDAAIERLMSEGRIKNVTLKIYPFGIGNVSTNVDNIDFVINK